MENVVILTTRDIIYLEKKLGWILEQKDYERIYFYHNLGYTLDEIVEALQLL